MNNSQLQKVLRLIRTTGDRVVVLDPVSDDVVVLMSLKEYEGFNTKKTKPIPPPEDLEPELAEEVPAPNVEEFIAEPLKEDERPLPTPAEEEQAPLPKPADRPARPGNTLNFSPDWAAHNAKSAAEDLSNLPEEPEEQFYVEPVE